MKKYFILFVLFFIFCSSTCKMLVPVVQRWPGGRVVYYFQSSFTESEKQTVKTYMKEWEYGTKVKFVECVTCQDDVFVLQIRKDRDRENLSSESYVGFGLFPSMKFGVMSQAIIIHELGHVIGLLHEHQRPDRNIYITVQYENVAPEDRFCFELRPEYDFLYKYRKFPYDYNSVMHYSNYSFSINGQPVILSPVAIGNILPSSIDIAKVIEIYGKPKKM